MGGNWNPGNTDSEEQSGSVHFLGSLGRIKPVQLPHDPTTHRMRWVKTGKNNHSLVVLPLHGRGNRGGSGVNGVNVTAYTPPADPFAGAWKTAIINNELHKAHNFDSVSRGANTPDHVVVGGAEGARAISYSEGRWHSGPINLPDMKNGAGEIRAGRPNPAGQTFLYACIEPMHGDTVAVYQAEGAKGKGSWKRTVLDDSLAQGHALAIADILGAGNLQVIAGWRNKNKEGKVGIKLYAPDPDHRDRWTTHLIDDDKMACEDLKVADLDNDGKPEIIACGRATRNVVIYWNKG